MTITLAATMLSLVLLSGCSAKTHSKALKYLDLTCDTYRLAEEAVDALQVLDGVEGKAAERIEKARRINRSACYALSKYDEQVREADPKE